MKNFKCIWKSKHKITTDLPSARSHHLKSLERDFMLRLFTFHTFLIFFCGMGMDFRDALFCFSFFYSRLFFASLINLARLSIFWGWTSTSNALWVWPVLNSYHRALLLPGLKLKLLFCAIDLDGFLQLQCQFELPCYSGKVTQRLG